MAYVLFVAVFISTVTPGVCERLHLSLEGIVADATSAASTDNATVVADRYVDIDASRLHAHNYYHANGSQSQDLPSRRNLHVVTGSALLATGGEWKLSDVLLLVFNMIGDLFGHSDAAFSAAQELIGVTVPDAVLQGVSDRISRAFSPYFGVGTSSIAAAFSMAKDADSLSEKFSEFKWNDPAFRPCFTLKRATALLDVLLEFLSFAASVASVLGDSLLKLTPPVNLWVGAGARIAGGIIWVLQTFALPVLEAQSCSLEGRDDADAMYGEANSAQIVESAKEVACRTPSPTSYFEACEDEEKKSRPCEAGETSTDSTDFGIKCQPWSLARKVWCYHKEKNQTAVKQAACVADSSAQLQTDMISIISSARRSVIEEFRITGDEAITEAIANRGGGVGGSQLAGKRDVGPEKRTLVKDINGHSMTWSEEPNSDDKTELRECCKIKAMCMHTAEEVRETNPSHGSLLTTKCTNEASACVQRVGSCRAATKPRFCYQAYFPELSPCCPQRGRMSRRCSEDLISDGD